MVTPPSPMNSSPNATISHTDINATGTTSLTRHHGQQPQPPNDNEEIDEYIDPSSNDLTIWPGAALIVADCMGTGILALPNNMKVLGVSGFVFLVINLPINYYAGDILHKAAVSVERRLNLGLGLVMSVAGDESDNGSGSGNGDDYRSIQNGPILMELPLSSRDVADEDEDEDEVNWNYDNNSSGIHNVPNTEMTEIRKPKAAQNQSHDHHQNHGITTPHTFDLIGITYALFDYFGEERRTATTSSLEPTSTSATLSMTTMIVTTIYYINIFLVLGNYILVMSHAVAAMIGEDNICLPNAGIIASTLMFAISQLRTMAMLGRSVSVISLLSLAIVVIQCLVAIQSGTESFSYNNNDDQGQDENDNENAEGGYYSVTFWQSLVSQLAALSSIGFAVGSQKLFLNIRHEFKDRNESPKSLGISLGAFGGVYILVCVLAGSDPPSLLFDAIAPGFQRRIAGFLLWVHVAVSYAINSQALCSSLERLKFHRITIFGLASRHRIRWAVLTLLVVMTTYFVANAVPFFTDLVALIGALTSVPLTLLLPALLHRKLMNVPLFWIGTSSSSSRGVWNDVPSLLLVYFSVMFLTCGLFGCIRSIQMDWANHGPPFACH